MPPLVLPRLKPTIQVLEHEDALTLRSAAATFEIASPPAWLRALLRALDGERELGAIATHLRLAGWVVEEDEFASAIDQLHEHGLLEDATADRMLTGRERKRYDRQLRYFSERCPPGESAAACQRRLREARVAVLGLGALGGHVVQLLAAAGVGAITAVDGDTVELSNLNRQTIYRESDAGRAKADVANERIRALNSDVQFKAQRMWLRAQADVETAVAGADFVVDAADNPPHEIERWVNDACFSLGLPYIGMSHYPPAIRVGPTYVSGETGCYRCQEVSWQRKDPLFDIVPDTWRPAALGATAGAVGAFVAMEVMSYLTGLARPLTVGTAIMLDLTTGDMTHRPIAQVPGCPICDPEMADADSSGRTLSDRVG